MTFIFVCSDAAGGSTCKWPRIEHGAGLVGIGCYRPCEDVGLQLVLSFRLDSLIGWRVERGGSRGVHLRGFDQHPKPGANLEKVFSPYLREVDVT